MIGYIIWDVSPEIFTIGSFSLRWYGLLFAATFFFGYLILKRFIKMDGLSIKVLDSLAMYFFIGTVIGARLGHCFFYEPEYYLSNPAEILKIWHGGLSSHGGAVGILIALYLFSRKFKIPMINILDRVVVVVALGGLLIRMGNLFNSEIYGIETTLPWGFIFVRAGETVPKHPTQIYEGLAALLIFFLLYKLFVSKHKQLHNGVLFGLFLTLLFTMRFFVEFIKEDQVAHEAGMVLNIGQWLSLPFILFGIGLLIYIYYKNKGFLIKNDSPKKS